MPIADSFVSSEDEKLSREFLERGYIIRPVADRDALDHIRQELVAAACRHLDCPKPASDHDFLDTIHKRVTPESVNALRLHCYREINKNAWLRPTYFKLSRPYIETLVGNELAMQNRINLSIQMPNDQGSVLDIHVDIFGGETPFEVVAWLPFVDVASTKSMYYLPRWRSDEVIKDLKQYNELGMAGLFNALKNQFDWLTVNYGEVVIFSPNALHGNTVNGEATSRWSFNCRFAPLLGPYYSPEKALGSFFLPITPKATTRIGLDFRFPEGFAE